MDLTNLNKDRKSRRKSSLDLSTMVYGKVPPQNVEAEKFLLGTLIMISSSLDDVVQTIRPETFYVDSHQRIYRAILSLSQKSQKIDLITLIEELKSREELDIVGGPYYLTQLTNWVTGAHNITAHADIIHRHFIKRELIRVAGEIISEAYEDGSEALELLEHAEVNLLAIGSSSIHNEMTSIDTALIQTVKKITEWQNNFQESGLTITGVPSGFPKLDRATRGWQPTDLIILAARPSVGKTALGLQFARHAAKNPIKSVAVAYWSLEMSTVSVVLRLLASEAGISLHAIQTGQLSEQNLNDLYTKGIQQLAKDEIFFDDVSSLTLFRLRSKARRLKKKHPNLGLIIIDYLQLMSGEEGKGTREQEVSKISRGLKGLARELGIPIIALSQLSREVEKRVGKKAEPKLSDLRESGSIEQDADGVLFLWGPDEDDIAKDPTLINKRNLKIAKQRNGVLVRVMLEFAENIQRFTEYEALKKGGFVPIDINKNIEGKREDPSEELPF